MNSSTAVDCGASSPSGGAALVIAALAIVAISVWLAGDEFGGTAVDHIAKVRIEGTITEDDELIERLEKIRKSAAVKGVILSIDSPGGTTAGGEQIFDEVRRLATEKPVVAQVGTLAASAGYMIASATDHIVARKSSIVGSIGVLVQFPDVTGLMDKLGIKLEEVKSSPLKAEPSPFNPTTDEERAMVAQLILDSYDWFVGIVDERRPLSRAEVTALADGSIFTGRQALTNKLDRRARRRARGDRLAGDQGRRSQTQGRRMEAGELGFQLAAVAFARQGGGALAGPA